MRLRPFTTRASCANNQYGSRTRRRERDGSPRTDHARPKAGKSICSSTALQREPDMCRPDEFGPMGFIKAPIFMLE
jgi:hypothetical protein